MAPLRRVNATMTFLGPFSSGCVDYPNALQCWGEIKHRGVIKIRHHLGLRDQGSRLYHLPEAAVERLPCPRVLTSKRHRSALRSMSDQG